jgi:hypothetical protein
MGKAIKGTLIALLLLMVFVGGVLVGNFYQLTDILCPPTAEPYILEKDFISEEGILIPKGTVVPLSRCAYMQRIHYQFAIDNAIELKPHSGTLASGYGFSELSPKRIAEALPADIQQYMDDYALCLHWMGEEAYSRERGKEIMKGFYQYCETMPNIDQRKSLLIEKYSGHPNVVDALKGYENLLPEIPVHE